MNSAFAFDRRGRKKDFIDKGKMGNILDFL
jgi:hypothetical protein